VIDDVNGYLFTHPACACGPTIDLVKEVAKEHNLIIKEVSLVSPEGRKQAFEAGVKTIPSLQLNNGTLLVTSKDITKEKILSNLLV
jgi:putative N-acetylmannosamine-6-phosphate epimerase